MLWQRVLFIALILICLSPYGSAPLALILGLLVAFTTRSPFPQLEGKPTRWLLKISVIFLGFGMDLKSVYETGKDGIIITVVTIFGTLLLGLLAGKLLGVRARTSALISAGTAICGGSAIAAVGPAINAEPDEMSVSLGTVFVLNSIALFTFPIIGHAVDLTQNQFGIWAAIAIHDTSSVVGAAGTYGAEALATATTVKLVRALWIAPVALIFAIVYRRINANAKIKLSFPWFILLFVLAAAFRSYAPPWFLESIYDSLVNLAKAGMIVTLFFIGASLTPEMLRNVGVRPMIQGVSLWLAVSVVSLYAVLNLV